ncbi:DNA-directed RNA polymerase III subunit RPC5-like [Odontomachus brunneus]|uniref:DNA-directed RNA polymerase III subunit RPC5-like n=1 Tax=Odontomachus brunneus TaxID=486640 RepID=UPI0013F1B648|nr:DNA-directed RNA polymerase III subunit RPC5-like [Odontomachus brunneus]
MEDDPVVKKIPVFLSKTLENKLLLLQYPTRPMNNDNFTVLKSCIKPNNLKVQLEFKVDTHSNNYNLSKGVKLVLNAKNESKRNENISDSELFDKITFSSIQSVTDCSNYAIGIFQNNELHITPLKGILEMQPQFNYLDKSDKRSKYKKHAPEEINSNEEENMVLMHTMKQQSESIKKLQEQSFKHDSKKNQEENWIHTTYVSTHETVSHLTRLEMLYPTSDITLNLSKHKYLDLLMPSRSQTFLEHIKTLPLQEQITSFVENARIISFSNLCSMLSLEHSTTDVLCHLQKVAMLVQGNWVLKSELIYPTGFISSQNNISADFMCRARDYILLLLMDHVYLKRDKIISVVKLPSAEVMEILEKLCTKDSKEGWKLMIPPDWNFCNRYPELAERQRIFWEAKRRFLRESREKPESGHQPNFSGRS